MGAWGGRVPEGPPLRPRHRARNRNVGGTIYFHRQQVSDFDLWPWGWTSHLRAHASGQRGSHPLPSRPPPAQPHGACQLLCAPRGHSGASALPPTAQPSTPLTQPAPAPFLTPLPAQDTLSAPLPSPHLHHGLLRAHGGTPVSPTECALSRRTAPLTAGPGGPGGPSLPFSPTAPCRATSMVRGTAGRSPGLGSVRPTPARPLTHHWAGEPSVPREASESWRAVFAREADGARVPLKSEPRAGFRTMPRTRSTGLAGASRVLSLKGI